MSVEGVIVAAGFSSRAGGWKMAFDLGGLTVIERCVLAMAAWCSRIIVVGGNYFDELQRLLPEHQYPQVQLVYNRNYGQGMFSSVLTGFRNVLADRFFFSPGDYPLISSAVYERLLSQAGDIVIPAYQGVTGHPVLFRTAAIGNLLKNPDRYDNLREFIAAHGFQVREVADPGILIDIDTEEDYWVANQYLSRA